MKFQWRYWNLHQQTVINLKYKQFPVNITYMGLGLPSNKYLKKFSLLSFANNLKTTEKSLTGMYFLC